MRHVLKDWLLSGRALVAYVNLLAAIGVLILIQRVSGKSGSEWELVKLVLRVVFALLAVYPIWHFLAPPLFMLALLVVLKFSKDKPAYPCPVCGYDIRMTPHRCPECGTKLRWGHLVD